MLDNQIDKIIGSKNNSVSNILSNQLAYKRKPGTVSGTLRQPQVNYTDVNNRIKQIFDRMPDVVKANGRLSITLGNGKTLIINVNYQ